MTTISGLRPLLIVGTLLTAMLTLWEVPALADGETCDGKPATIVVSTAPVEFDVNGTPADDVIVVTTPDPLRVNGLGGDDTICGGARTWVRGAEGNDVIHGGDGQTHLEGGTGNDTIRGGGGADQIAGDSLITPATAPATSDNDTIDAGSGADTIIDDWGNDIFAGGSGADRLVLGVATDHPPKRGCKAAIAATPTLAVADGTVTGFGDDTFTGFETYVGGTVESTLIGTSGPDDLRSGECGVAHLVGLAGADRLEGHSYVGGLLSANSGPDKIFVSGAYDVHAGRGDDRIRLEAEYNNGTNPARHHYFRGERGTDWVIDDALIGEIDLRRGFKLWTREWLPVDGVENARQIENPFSSGRMASVAEPERVMHITGTAGPNVLVAPWATGKYPVALHGLAGNDRLLGDNHVTAYGGSGRDFCRAEHRHGCERR